MVRRELVILNFQCFDEELVNILLNTLLLLENKVFQVHYSTPIVSPEDAVFKLIEKEVQQGGKLSSKKEGDVTAIYLDERCILKARDGQMIFLNLLVDGFLDDAIFIRHNTIEEVYLENVNGMYKSNFISCWNLKKVSMPNCLTVGSYCFERLPNLEDVSLEKIKTSMNTIMGSNNFGETRKMFKELADDLSKDFESNKK